MISNRWIRISSPQFTTGGCPNCFPVDVIYRTGSLASRIPPPMNGFLHHLRLTLKLNFRNPQAVVFGYVVPIFFLFAYGSVFGGQSKAAPLTRQLGQLLTISVLGGACFGMPIAFVSERERGVWRRY